MKTTLPAWLDDAVLYNIYPQSFYDSNADGIGDLAGILKKIDYIQSLGVNVIWLNPIYPSPFQDAGYDVTDYYNVAPRYGTKQDLKRLLDACHKRGIRLLLDFVPGHTSNQHPWFKQSALPEKNKYTNWFVWNDSGFGDFDQTLVRGYSDRSGHYKPNFFWFQPSLNYGYADPKRSWQLPTNHPDAQSVLKEMEKVMRYWLDFGVDGFRVDMAASLVKEDKDNKANKALWQRVRRWWDKDYSDRILVSEWSWPSRAIDSGFHIDFMIHFNNDAYNSLFRFEYGRNIFDDNRNSYFDKKGKGDIGLFLKYYKDFLGKTQGKGYISLPSGNHDIPRINHGRSVEELKVAYTFLLTLPGVPTLYYGDEIGMRNVVSAPNKEGGYIRTQARTPMQWSKATNAGFSKASAKKLYLLIDPKNDRPTVEAQENNKKSLLNFVRSLTGLRKKHPALSASGTFKALNLDKKGYPFAYLRKKGKEEILIILNPSGQRREAALPVSASALQKSEVLLGNGVKIQVNGKKAKCICAPTSFAVIKL